MVEIEEVGGILSTFISRIEDSELKNQIDIIYTRINDAIELENLTQHELDTIYRVKEVYNIVQNRFFSVDPYLVSEKVHENIITNTKTVQSQLHSFIQNHNNNNANAKTQNINKINEFLDHGILINISQIFYPTESSDVEALKESIVSTRSSLSQHNRYIKEEYEEFSAQKQRLEQEINSLSTHLTSIEEKVDHIVENAHNQLNEFERRFSDKQQERTEDFSELQSELKESYTASLGTVDALYNSKVLELERDSNSFKRELESRMDKYKDDLKLATEELYKLVEVAGSNVMSDGYAKYANEAATRRFWWQIVSVVSLIGLVLSTIFIIIPSIQGDVFSWTELVSRVLITLSVGALSGYTIRQSQLAYNEEQRNREMQLKLGSIEPYLKNFELEKRNKIKEKLVVDYFSRTTSNWNADEVETPQEEPEQEETTA
jgi:hypothetical protein